MFERALIEYILLMLSMLIASHFMKNETVYREKKTYSYFLPINLGVVHQLKHHPLSQASPVELAPKITISTLHLNYLP
jgi:hypothetical protein